MQNDYPPIRKPSIPGSRSRLLRQRPFSPQQTQEVAPITSLTVNRDSTGEWENLIGIFRKQKALLFLFVAGVLVATGVVTWLMTPLYEATAQIQVDPPGSDVFTLRENPNAGGTDLEYIGTQAKILQSDELAVDVIRRLHLDDNPNFEVAPSGLSRTLRVALGSVIGLLSHKTPHAESSGPTQLTQKEINALHTYQANLAVEPISNSRLIRCIFTHRDPVLAASVVNTLADLFIEKNYQKRYQISKSASTWLSGQLDDLRAKVDKSNAALANYQNKNGIVEVENDETPLTQNLSDLNRQLAQAQSDRIQLQAYVGLIQSGNTQSLPQIRDNQFFQGLMQKLVDSRSDLAQAQALYGDNNARVRKLQSEVKEIERQVSGEEERVKQELTASYTSAVNRENLLTQAIDSLNKVAQKQSNNMIQFGFLKTEAKSNQELYSNLLSDLEKATISATMESTNVRLVDRARVPDLPSKPNVIKNLGLGLLVGIVGGIGLMFVRDGFDNKITEPDDVKKYTGISPVALLPRLRAQKRSHPVPVGSKLRLTAAGQSEAPENFFTTKPLSLESEAVRKLHAAFRTSEPRRQPRRILVVSPGPREGKTTIATNLAVALAQHGTTCLVDADMRGPRVARVFELKPKVGLGAVLAGSAQLTEALLPVRGVPTLSILPGEPAPDNPGDLFSPELIASLIGALSERFENVIVDAPPIVPYADARIIAPFMEGVILVGRSGVTTRESLLESTEILKDVSAVSPKIVLNGVNPNSQFYRYQYYDRSSDTQLKSEARSVS